MSAHRVESPFCRLPLAPLVVLASLAAAARAEYVPCKHGLFRCGNLGNQDGSAGGTQSNRYEAADGGDSSEQEPEPQSPPPLRIPPPPGRAAPRVFRVLRPGGMRAEPGKEQSSRDPAEVIHADQAVSVGGAGASSDDGGDDQIGQFPPLRSKLSLGGGGAAGRARARDPGYWTGTWYPPTWPDGTPNANGMLRVVDPSGVRGQSGVSVIPAAENQGDAMPRSVANKPPATWARGQTVAVRHRSDENAGAGSFKLFGMSGADVGMSVSISLSTIPGDFGASAVAQATGSRNPSFGFGTLRGVTHSTLVPNTAYYFNIRANEAGTHHQFNFMYPEPNSMRASPLADSAPPSEGPGSGVSEEAGGSCTLPNDSALAAGGGPVRLWYKNTGCVDAYFICKNGALTLADYSPRPTPPSPGAKLFMNLESCH